jgi:mono/diheme cytochrome c family protein
MVKRFLGLLAALLVTGSALAASAGPARINYLLHCSGCHQQDGTGSVENGIPDMKGHVGHFLRTPEGRAFLVQVPGTSQAALNDADIAQLLNWMVVALSRNEVPADFLPYSTEEVARLRANRLDDVPGYRAGVVGRLKQMGYRVE